MENVQRPETGEQQACARDRDDLMTKRIDDLEARLLLATMAAGHLAATVDDSITVGFAPCDDERNLATDRLTKLLARLSDVYEALGAVREAANE